MQRDRKEAARWYTELAARPDSNALFMLGGMYEYGDGVKKDSLRSTAYYQQAARLGHSQAMLTLGYHYAATRPDSAEYWYQKAADLQLPEAQYNLALLYFSRGDVAQGLPFLEAAARLHYAEAENNLGNLYAEGRYVAKDPVRAFQLYKRAAEQRLPEAQNNCGNMLEAGEGTAANPASALEYYARAAAQNYAEAQYNLARLYATGTGTAQDWQKAATWFERAAQQGKPEAQYNIGILYLRGQGVTADAAKAHHYLRLAAQSSSPVAAAARALLH